MDAVGDEEKEEDDDENDDDDDDVYDDTGDNGNNYGADDDDSDDDCNGDKDVYNRISTVTSMPLIIHTCIIKCLIVNAYDRNNIRCSKIIRR